MSQSATKPYDVIAWLDAFLGGTMLSSVFWLKAIEHVSLILHFLILLSGAVVGLHGVYRIWKGRRPVEVENGEE